MTKTNRGLEEALNERLRNAKEEEREWIQKAMNDFEDKITREETGHETYPYHSALLWSNRYN